MKSPANFICGCSIIEGIITEFEKINLKQQGEIKSALLNDLMRLSSFITSVISQYDISIELKVKVFTMLEGWIAFENSKLLNNSSIQTILLTFLQHESLSQISIQCLVKGFASSEYSGLLESMSYDLALKEFTTCPLLSFLEQLLNAVATSKVHCCRAYAELVFSIGANFSIIFLKASLLVKLEYTNVQITV